MSFLPVSVEICVVLQIAVCGDDTKWNHILSNILIQNTKTKYNQSFTPTFQICHVFLQLFIYTIVGCVFTHWPKMPETHVSCRHSSVRLSHHPDNNDATGAGGGAAGRRQCVFVNPPAAVDWSVGRSSGERRSLAPLPCSSPTSTVHPTPPPLPTYPSLPPLPLPPDRHQQRHRSSS